MANHSMSRQRGFTLIEIMVVVVIISIIIAAAALSIGVLGGDREAEAQARRMWAVLQQTREESELQGVDSGMYMATAAYELLRFQPRVNAWQPVPDDPLYVPRRMPAGLAIRARLDGRDIVLKPDLTNRTLKPVRKLTEDGEARKLGEDDADGLGSGFGDKKKSGFKKDDSDNPSPQIVLLSSGEVQPFEIEFQREGAPALWRVVGTVDNDLRVERRNDDSRWEIIAQVKDPEEEEPKSRARK